MQPTELDIQLRRRNRTLFDRNTEQDGNDDA
jgi:hypothetical protein